LLSWTNFQKVFLWRCKFALEKILLERKNGIFGTPTELALFNIIWRNTHTRNLAWIFFNITWTSTRACHPYNVGLSRAGVHNSNLMTGPNFFFDTSKGQPKLLCFNTFKECFYIKGRSKIWGFAGQIKSFCGPHFAPRAVCFACLL